MFLLGLLAGLAAAPSASAAPLGERADARAESCGGPCPIVLFAKGSGVGTINAVTEYTDRPNDVTPYPLAARGQTTIFIDEFAHGAYLQPAAGDFRGWQECPVPTGTSICRVYPGASGSVCVGFGAPDPVMSSCPPPFIQAYKKGDGKGIITAEAPGRGPAVACDVLCPVGIWTHFAPGDVITLKATATQGTFFRWELCPAPIAPNQCNVTLTNVATVCAVFATTPPTDNACPAATPVRPQPPPNLPPNTRITAGPSPTRATRSRRATFRFVSTEARSTFLCRLDSKPWLPCRSPKVVRNLKLGRHTFRVKANDRTGKIDPTPAVRRWRIRA